MCVSRWSLEKRPSVDADLNRHEKNPDCVFSSTLRNGKGKSLVVINAFTPDYGLPLTKTRFHRHESRDLQASADEDPRHQGST